MRWIILAALCVTGCHSQTSRLKNQPGDSQWNPWSSCSTTCGEGIQERVRECPTNAKPCGSATKETKQCFSRFCPSYLSWPRIHFSGSLLADVNTVNNVRCAYENDQFAASQLSENYIVLQKTKSTHTYYKNSTKNWNPDGTNQIYFVDTYVTSFCGSPGICQRNASIVGLEVTETARGVVAELDVDWQIATELWAWRIRIPGVLEGDYKPGSHHAVNIRVDNQTLKDVGYSHGLMVRFKSKLTNIVWSDPFYEKLFNHATVLSIQFVMDLYNQYSLKGRISGTIGLTSPDDPQAAAATRRLQPYGNRGNAPFFIYYDQRYMTIDFGIAIGGRDDGRILATDLGKLDFVMLLPRSVFCKYFSDEEKSVCVSGANGTDLVSKALTTGGELTKRVADDAVWFLTYGGILDIDIKHLDLLTLNLLRRYRVAIMEQQADGTEKIYMSEFPKGVVIGLKNDPTVRLNPGDSKTWQTFVSSYGKPVSGVEFELFTVQHHNADLECLRSSCNLTNGVPRDALEIVSRPSSKSNAIGLVTFVMTAVKDPGNIRGCGLDGQLYPLRMFAKYKTGNKTLTFSDDSGMEGSKAQYQAVTLSICARIYNAVPEKQCPSWNDVKSTFIRYYNLYPAMWKAGIVDLHSYSDIKKKAKILEVSMFELDVNDPRHMPITRDLSAGNKQLIWNWLKCGMKRYDLPENKEESSVECTKEYVEKETKNIHILLSKALMFELSTIPPYVTSWLSLKTEYGRNKEIADIIKSVFNEEMLHLTLAANILNAVGGDVVTTDESKLPIFSTILASGDSYQLSPNVQVSIQPFSLGLVENIFSAVEKPADYETRQIFYALATIWKMLPENSKSFERVSYKMELLVAESKLQGGAPSEKCFEAFTHNINSSTSKEDLLKLWKCLKKFAEENLYKVDKKLGKTVGELYARIALRLTILESCLRIADLESAQKGVKNIFNSSTIFIGDPSYQLNASNWYEQNSQGLPNLGETVNPKNLTRPPLFQVINLKSALEAVVEIVYQGEGGSECSPFVTEPQIYASYEGRESGHEISHYYRFQEIVYGRKLTKIENPPSWVDLKCLNATNCPSLVEAGESYCYAGKHIPFHEDGVWPILPDPKPRAYQEGSKAFHLHHQFNLLFTRLLFCLQETYGGNPSHIRICMTIMYDLTIAGKRLVQTPLRVSGNTTAVEIGKTGKNGSPTWRFVRDKPFRAGFPIRA